MKRRMWCRLAAVAWPWRSSLEESADPMLVLLSAFKGQQQCCVGTLGQRRRVFHVASRKDSMAAQKFHRLLVADTQVLASCRLTGGFSSLVTQRRASSEVEALRSYSSGSMDGQDAVDVGGGGGKKGGGSNEEEGKGNEPGEQAAGPRWKIVARPVLETILRRYGQIVKAERVMVVHGPRGVGKRTVAERVLLNWQKGHEHATAYIDLVNAPSRDEKSDARMSVTGLSNHSRTSPWTFFCLEGERGQPQEEEAASATVSSPNPMEGGKRGGGSDHDHHRDRSSLSGTSSRSEEECSSDRLSTMPIMGSTAPVWSLRDPLKTGLPREFGSRTLPRDNSVAAWAAEVGEVEEREEEDKEGVQELPPLLYPAANVDCSGGSHGVGFFKAVLEQKLEELTRRAVDLRLINTNDVLNVLLESHAIDGALQQIIESAQLHNSPEGKEESVGVYSVDCLASRGLKITTKVLWEEALWLVHNTGGHFCQDQQHPSWIQRMEFGQVLDRRSRQLGTTQTKQHNTRLQRQVPDTDGIGVIFSSGKGSTVSFPSGRGRKSNLPPPSVGLLPADTDTLVGVNKYVPTVGKPEVRGSTDPKSVWTALALAKQVLSVHQEWRQERQGEPEGNTASPQRSGPIADALTSWSTLLIDLLSGASVQGKFQPKLIINGIDVLRRLKDLPSSVCSGTAFHDMLIMRVLDRAVKNGCMPIVLVSSDSYYSADLANDFGSADFFESLEVFAWTPAEAAVHCVPRLFNEKQWNKTVEVLGAHPRHLSEFYSSWQRFNPRNAALEIERCLEEYLFFLQVSVVDPAMEKALDIVQLFAREAATSAKPMLEGVAWKRLPNANDLEDQMAWAHLQMMDFIKSLAGTEFAISYQDDDAVEFLEDPAAQALLHVGLLYQQRHPPYIRPTTKAFQRCLVRWYVREKVRAKPMIKLGFTIHGFIRGRSYRHLMKDD